MCTASVSENGSCAHVVHVDVERCQISPRIPREEFMILKKLISLISRTDFLANVFLSPCMESCPTSCLAFQKLRDSTTKSFTGIRGICLDKLGQTKDDNRFFRVHAGKERS